MGGVDLLLHLRGFVAVADQLSVSRAAEEIGVDQPLLADDVADAIAWVATRPSHVDIDELVIKPRAQAAAHKVHRT